MTDLTGKTIGQYQLIEQKGETAYYVLCRAFQPAFNRYAAIKILKPSSARQPDEVQRFRQQGDLQALFHHPRLVEVYETGEANGLFFRAMRWADNGSLRDQVSLGMQSQFYNPRAALALFQGIVEGLEQIHAQGYIHGNLTPGNVLLDELMQPLLNDYGLPARIGGPATPYQAPEQVQGGIVDRRSDVYALGVLLYTTLVGAEPPAGVVASLRARRPEIPDAVDRVVFKALAQNPDQRFQSASEFLAALQSAIETPQPAPAPVYTPPPSPAPVPMQSITQTVNVESEKKGPNVIGILIGVIFVLILCIAAVYSYRVFMENQGAATAVPTQPAGQPTQAPPIIILPSQPPPVTEVQPTRESRPTNPPEERPTEPPEQPAEPPEQPPQVEQPIATPVEGSPGTGLLPCGSAAVIFFPMFVWGASQLKKKGRI